ncbi:alpha-L-arabinofuranosidase [Rhexocercosporidium sp. MPI-PUGE-AT-0058]|nr:alpha-L-arabinofuranosidase [Rhexocercosporidium sp. MPI-PUGE-AT-0058]
MLYSRPTLPSSGVLILGLMATTGVATGPCDIYASGGTPCVAAHGTTRALYGSYAGALYQVRRADGKTTDIKPLSAGGVANSAAQDTFCSGTTCLISIIYDQSGKGNHLTQAPPGSAGQGPAAGGKDNLASAVGAPVTLGGKKAYGVFIPPGTGYRNNAASGTAKGDGAQGMYAVLDGTHYNGGCCFDYGNAETSSTDTGAAHMEAIYFGNIRVWGSGAGNGPWIMADLENGLFSGQGAKTNTGDPSISYRFTTAIVKGTANKWAIRGANAASGALSTFYNGVRPNGYNPMKKEGAIILGIGGDNSHGAQGTFYEGVMTSGYPTDATENAVQANIVAAGYGTSSRASGTTLAVDSSVSLSTATGSLSGRDASIPRYITHSGSVITIEAVSSDSDHTLKQQATWTVRSGLSDKDCVSFESADTPGSYIRFQNATLVLNASDGSKEFNEDATFCTEKGLTGSNSNSIRSWNHPTRYIRNFDNATVAAEHGGVNIFDAADGFHNDASWDVGTALI